MKTFNNIINSPASYMLTINFSPYCEIQEERESRHTAQLIYLTEEQIWSHSITASRAGLQSCLTLADSVQKDSLHTFTRLKWRYKCSRWSPCSMLLYQSNYFCFCFVLHSAFAFWTYFLPSNYRDYDNTVDSKLLNTFQSLPWMWQRFPVLVWR